uniref:Chorismate lyase n=1 Tax=Gelidium vagum TaxID=35171 RepID=A0A141SE34_GELVA|nr:hypothetical protein Gvag_097 [Gelidium vagum]AMK96552.1 hypothetical protein Gvag_097 [Gelidium vagum]
MIHISNKYKFYKTTNLHISSNFVKAPIPKTWKLILTSDGSFTQNLNSITNKIINVHIQEQYIQDYINTKLIVRQVWLQDTDNNKLTFAQSLWYINKYSNICLSNNIPVGQLFLESGMDIYRSIEEIYCGHSRYLEDHFNSKDTIWGRKYKIYHRGKVLTIIYEFFSSHIINLIQK